MNSKLNQFVIFPTYSRHLKWIGKIARMGYNRMPRKMLFCWINNSRPIGRPLTSIRHTYLDGLWRIKTIISDDTTCRKVQDWFLLAKNKEEWKKV